MSTPSTPPPMGPPGASPFGNLSPSGGNVQPIQPPPSKSMAMWEKFLGAGATPAQVEKFQAQFLNMITSQLKKEAQKSREKSKKDEQMVEGHFF